MGVGSSFRLTVQERILIHLSEYARFIDNIEVPFAITQEGIAQAIGVVRSAIPRAIKKLISDNKVKEILAHVTGVSRRRKVYHLTTDGLVSALNIKEKLSNLEIYLLESNGERIKIKIKETSERLGEDIKLLEIILNLDKNNVFNYSEILARKRGGSAQPLSDLDEGIGATEPVPEEQMQHTETSIYKTDKLIDESISEASMNLIEKAPKIKFFIGRKNEIESIENCLNEVDCKIIIIYGIAGIGKTTLAAKLLEILENKYNLFWYRFHEWDTIRNLLNSISKFLMLFDRKSLKLYLDSNQNIDINDVGEILEMDIKGLNAVLFLDDLHKVDEQLMSFFTLFREILERADDNAVKCILLSRSFVPFYDRRDVLVKKNIHEIELTGLNEEESKELLKYRNVKITNFKQLYELTRGHPLSLEILEPEMELQEQKNIKLYLEEEVLNRLSLREKSLLKLASVFRYPVPADGFFIYEKAQINRETLSILTRKALIKESPDGYEVHDLIKDFFYSYLTNQERESYHHSAGQFYIERLKLINEIMKKKFSTVFRPEILTRSITKRGNLKNLKPEGSIEPLMEQRSRGILETQYHFLKSREFNRAAEVAILMGHELLNLTYVEELRNNLDQIDLNQVSDEYKMDLQIVKADALSVMGNIEDAQRLYERSLDIAEKEDDRTRMAEIYCKLGSIKEKLNQYDSAIKFLNKSLEISKTIGNAKQISDAYGSLGDVYWKMTKFDKSNEYYNKCLESAESITDLPGKAKTFLLLGIQSAKHGQLEESLKYYERCLDILDKGKGLNGINYANFYENLGDHYLKTIFSFFIQNNGKKPEKD